ncbi:hypothetical protein [Dyadobacter luticola]|uniref:Uncharacterized protein n=1 Tax=Dyadobacter luticola TaxID=1979387 RepID=A0A5R9L4L9_9BACT|nr:hypothetical protein [Dyadobacter luticola]TLV03516.1 hypothetical protein FEN17_07895 [Dyadobacter luticola]
MKRLLFSTLILASVFFAISCAHKTVDKQDVAVEEFDKNKFYGQLNNVPFYISQAYRVVGKDTVNVLADSIMRFYRDAVYVTFRDDNGSDGIGYVQFYVGKEWDSPTIPVTPPARAFYLNMKFSRSTSMTFQWDDTRKTVVVNSSGVDEAFRLVPPGKTAYLDTSRYHYKYDFEAAKTGADQSMTWIFEDYTIVMKPMYVVYRYPDGASWDRGIVVY